MIFAIKNLFTLTMMTMMLSLSPSSPLFPLSLSSLLLPLSFLPLLLFTGTNKNLSKVITPIVVKNRSCGNIISFFFDGNEVVNAVTDNDSKKDVFVNVQKLRRCCHFQHCLCLPVPTKTSVTSPLLLSKTVEAAATAAEISSLMMMMRRRL